MTLVVVLLNRGAQMAGATDPRITVPDDERPAARCRYCDRPFKAERLYALHLGVSHPEECTDDERERYEELRDEESHDLFTFHVKIVVTLTLTYFSLMYLYGFVWA